MFKKIQLPTRKSFLINLDSPKLPRCMLKTYSGPDTPSLFPSSRANVFCMLTFSCSNVSYMLSAYMPTCIVCLCARVLTCLACLRVQVPTCFRCSCPHLPTCLDCLYAHVSKWNATSCVDTCQHGLSPLPTRLARPCDHLPTYFASSVSSFDVPFFQFHCYCCWSCRYFWYDLRV